MTGTDADPAPEPNAVAATSSTTDASVSAADEQALAGALREARRLYCLAAHDAGIVASQAWWRAYAELGAAQQRILSDAGWRRGGAYQAWLRTVGTVGPNGGGWNSAAIAYQIYRQEIEEAANAERHDWETAQNAYRTAMSAANETLAAAKADALKAYLGRIQTALGQADIAALGAPELVRLAHEAAYAAQLVRSRAWVRH